MNMVSTLKKIAIVSEDGDFTTQLVVDYLHQHECSHEILNIEQLYDDLFYKKLKFYGIWLRRQNIKSYSIKYEGLFNEILTPQYFYHYYCQSFNKVLGSILSDYQHNKLNDLFEAKNMGLKIPKSYIIESKTSIKNLLEKYKSKRFITKAFFNQKTFLIGNLKYSGGAPVEICLSNIDQIKVETFCPSLVQEYVEKEFEIRIFYLDGLFFSMAIFSQNDAHTSLDYRNYNRFKPNRNVPYELPDSVKKKVTKLMKKLKLNTGSIDMIYSTTEEYVFLEVNPVGQFGWLSENCNYYIEKKIAEYLSN